MNKLGHRYEVNNEMACQISLIQFKRDMAASMEWKKDFYQTQKIERVRKLKEKK